MTEPWVTEPWVKVDPSAAFAEVCLRTKGVVVLTIPELVRLADESARAVDRFRATCPHAEVTRENRATTYRVTCDLCGAVRGGGML